MMRYQKVTTISILIILLTTVLQVSSNSAWAATTTYYISTQGNDSNNGSSSSPWRTLAYAVEKVQDTTTTIIVKDGVYDQCITIRRQFQTSLLIKAEHPYRVRWQCNQALPIIKFAAAKNITLEGFEITRPDLSQSYEWFVIVWNSSNAWAENITFRNNIFHDSVKNDLLRIGPGVNHITVENNMFYNQAGADEHIDINGARDVIVQGNIFFNDFEGSGRPNLHDTSSYIVIKDSTGAFGGSQQVRVRQNVFLNWEGKYKQFVLVGEDGISTFEAVDVIIENNLMLGNGADPIWSPLAIRGSKNVTVRANTIVGNLPSLYFGVASYITKDNPRNENINIYNNIWSDPTGTMGEAFSCCSPSQTLSYAFDNNLFFNKAKPFPSSSDSFVEVTSDAHRIIGDPKLGDQSKGITVPRWNGTNFNGNYSTIRNAFVGLVVLYGAPAAGSAAIDKANPAYMPDTDILGIARSSVNSKPDIGAYEVKGFTVDVTPTFQAIDPGQSAKYTIQIEPITVNSVTIATGPVSSHVKLDLSPTTMSLPGTTTLTLSSTDSSPLIPGIFVSLPVTIAGGDFTQLATVQVLIGGIKTYLPMIRK